MAGHPPHISDERNGSQVEFSFNECPSVPLTSVKRSFEALKRAKLLPASATIEAEDGRIYIIIPAPTNLPADRRTAAYKSWRDPLRNIIHAMNICIQSERAPQEVVAYIGRVLRAA